MGDTQHLNQLLPGCSLGLFSNDKATIKTFEALKDDWRCASLTLKKHNGGIKDATDYYKDNKSPDLLLIQTNESDADALVQSLENLAEYCSENTSAILIGPENDVNLYRRLTRMGVLDYLVAPVSPERLLDIVGTAALDKHGIADNLMSIVMGSRGGAGTSVIASLLAYGLSEIGGRKTALCDLMPGRSALPVYWSTECPGGLADLASAFQSGDISALYRLAPKASENLHIFTPSTDTPFEFALGHDEQMELLQGLRQHFPTLVYDTAGFTPKILKNIIPSAPHVIMVTPPTVTGLRSTKKMLSQIEPIRGGDSGHIKIVLNRVKEMGSDELSPKDIKEIIGHEPELEIMYDKNIAAKLETGQWRDDNQVLSIAGELAALVDPNSNTKSLKARGGKKGGLLSWLKD